MAFNLTHPIFQKIMTALCAYEAESAFSASETARIKIHPEDYMSICADSSVAFNPTFMTSSKPMIFGCEVEVSRAVPQDTILIVNKRAEEPPKPFKPEVVWIPASWTKPKVLEKFDLVPKWDKEIIEPYVKCIEPVELPKFDLTPF